MRHNKIAVFHMYALILSIIFYDMGHTRDGTLKSTLQNFHMIFFEQRYLS